MPHHETDRHPSGRQGRPAPQIVDLDAPAPSAVLPIHNIAVDLQGAPAWRLWVMVAILGVGTSLALLAT